MSSKPLSSSQAVLMLAGSTPSNLLRLLAFSCLLLAGQGCENSHPAEPDDGVPGDAAPAPIADAAAAVEDLGKPCALGCAGTDTCAASSDTCGTGICTFDGSEAYCTEDCTTASCPEGFVCGDTAGFEGAPNRVCWKDHTPVEMGSVQLDLDIEMLWNGEVVLVKLAQSIPIANPARPCGAAYALGATPYPDYLRRWDKLYPCFEVVSELRDAALVVQAPIPHESGAADFPSLRWSLQGHFSSSDSDTNNFWEYKTNTTVHVASVERAGGRVRTTMTVDYVAPRTFCSPPDNDQSRCDAFAENVTIRGSAVWEIPDTLSE